MASALAASSHWPQRCGAHRQCLSHAVFDSCMEPSNKPHCSPGHVCRCVCFDCSIGVVLGDLDGPRQLRCSLQRQPAHHCALPKTAAAYIRPVRHAATQPQSPPWLQQRTYLPLHDPCSISSHRLPRKVRHRVHEPQDSVTQQKPSPIVCCSQERAHVVWIVATGPATCPMQMNAATLSRTRTHLVV